MGSFSLQETHDSPDPPRMVAEPTSAVHDATTGHGEDPWPPPPGTMP